MANGISKYAEKYLEAKFGHLHEEIVSVKQEVKGIKDELKKNGKCLGDIKDTMGTYKIRVRHLTVAVAILFLMLIAGVISGIELITKGILAFFR